MGYCPEVITFFAHSQCAVFFSKHLDAVASFHCPSSPVCEKRHYYFITHKGTEAQIGEQTFLKPPSRKVVELEFESSLSKVCGSENIAQFCLTHPLHHFVGPQ